MSAILAVFILAGLNSCTDRTGYEIEFTNCSEEVIRWSVESDNYTLPVDEMILRGKNDGFVDGYVKSEVPSSLSLKWEVERTGSSREEVLRIAPRLPSDFKKGRDEIVIAIHDDHAEAYARIFVTKYGSQLVSLKDGRRTGIAVGGMPCSSDGVTSEK